MSLINPICIQIGKYLIELSFKKSNSIFIFTKGGEGGEFNKTKFEKVIDKFFKENF